MKTLYKVFLLVLICFSFSSSAQTTDHQKDNQHFIAVNQGNYFYIPNLQAYFDSSDRLYYYKLNGAWIASDELPNNYGGYSIYNKIRVSIADFNKDNPGQFLAIHKKMFPYNSKGRFTNTTASQSVAED